MNKRQVLPFAALSLLAAGGIALGAGQAPGLVRAQTPTTQTQAVPLALDKESQKQEAKIGAEGTEPANEVGQEKNLPGGGHQDAGGNTDHQFEGVE